MVTPPERSREVMVLENWHILSTVLHPAERCNGNGGVAVQVLLSVYSYTSLASDIDLRRAGCVSSLTTCPNEAVVAEGKECSEWAAEAFWIHFASEP